MALVSGVVPKFYGDNAKHQRPAYDYAADKKRVNALAKKEHEKFDAIYERTMNVLNLYHR